MRAIERVSFRKSSTNHTLLTLVKVPAVSFVDFPTAALLFLRDIMSKSNALNLMP